LRPEWKEKLKAAQLSGSFTLDSINFKGSLEDWGNAAITASGQSALVSLYGYQLTKISLRYQQGNSANASAIASPDSHLDLTGQFYSGNVTLAALIATGQKGLPFQVEGKLENTNLSRLTQESPLAKKDISGTLSLALNVDGSLLDTESFTGKGAVWVEQGELGRLNLFKGIWRLLVIPEFENIVFTEAQAQFRIQDERLITEDLYLKSEPVEIYGEGWLDFQKNVELGLTAQFRESEILSSESVRRALTKILTHAQDYVGVKITGPVDRPQFERVILPGKAVKKVTEKLLEGVQDLFEEILSE
jgi:hypothetical protein